LQTLHRVLTGDARYLHLPADSVQLVVTSPPYPMIEMWDAFFGTLAPKSARLRENGDGMGAFEAMHAELDRVWAGVARVLAPGGFACVNIGDATRTIDGRFCLYPNHARISTAMMALGLTPLPDILWRKPNNSPNKFMGSGMLPAGAYVTYEHEYVLIFRKGDKRVFATPEDKVRRARSAFFWEERNTWFSDLWSDLLGVQQGLGARAARARSAAFPFELAFRLVSMYSVAGDLVLDPFMGTGTTALAAAATARNSVGVELEPDLAADALADMPAVVALGNARVDARLAAHRTFVEERRTKGKLPGHVSDHYGFPVVTGQETRMELWRPVSVRPTAPNEVEVTHSLQAAQRSLL